MQARHDTILLISDEYNFFLKLLMITASLPSALEPLPIVTNVAVAKV
jgi:hypothetical protein